MSFHPHRSLHLSNLTTYSLSPETNSEQLFQHADYLHPYIHRSGDIWSYKRSNGVCILSC